MTTCTSKTVFVRFMLHVHVFTPSCLGVCFLSVANFFLTIIILYIPHTGTGSQESFGLYIQAFCTGLDQVLDSYRNTLIDLEKQVIFNLTC